MSDALSKLLKLVSVSNCILSDMDLEHLKLLASTASADQNVLIFWNKNRFHSIQYVRKKLHHIGFTDIHFAYILPNWKSPKRVISAEGVALSEYYFLHEKSALSFNPLKFLRGCIRTLVYKLNLIKLTETSLICLAKVK